MNNIYVKKILIEDHESEDLNYELQRKFGFDYDTHKKFVEINEGDSGRADTSPICIKELEEIVSRMKCKGATHIEIYYHGDHDSYIFSGLKIEPVTEEEQLKIKQKEIAEIDERIMVIGRQIELYHKQIEELENKKANNN